MPPVVPEDMVSLQVILWWCGASNGIRVCYASFTRIKGLQCAELFFKDLSHGWQFSHINSYLQQTVHQCCQSHTERSQHPNYSSNVCLDMEAAKRIPTGAGMIRLTIWNVRAFACFCTG